MVTACTYRKSVTHITILPFLGETELEGSVLVSVSSASKLIKERKRKKR